MDNLYYTLLTTDLVSNKELKNIAVPFGQRKMVSRNVKFADSPITVDMSEVGKVVAILVVTSLPITITSNIGTVKITDIFFATIESDITSLTIGRESVSGDVGAEVEIFFWADAS